MGWTLLFAVFLYLVCAALIIAEVFIPSGGLLSILSISCLVGGAVLFFQYGTTTGWIGLVVAAVMVPSALVFAYYYLPKTRFGKSVTLAPPVRQQGDAIPDTDQLKGMLGQTGVVVTPLRPVGMCEFSGQRLECVADSGYVDRGKKVTVVHVESTQVTVRVNQES